MRDDHTDERYVLVEQHDAGIGAFLLGVLLGAGAALLFAPQAGEDTRRYIEQRARKAGSKARKVFDDVASSVGDQFDDVKHRVEERVDEAGNVIRRGRRQVERAVDAGKSAAHEARRELERKLADSHQADDVA